MELILDLFLGLGFGLALSGLAGYVFRRSVRTYSKKEKWLETQGLFLGSSVLSMSVPEEGDVFGEVLVRYSYEVGGSRYYCAQKLSNQDVAAHLSPSKGDNVNIDLFNSLAPLAVPEGTEIIVWHNPINPKDVSLHRKKDLSELVAGLILATIFLGVGMAYLIGFAYNVLKL